MSKKLIDLYKEWMETGRMPEMGLCNSLPFKYYESLLMFEPQSNRPVYWGCGLEEATHIERWYSFTPLRQTIVLFICAMKNEL